MYTVELKPKAERFVRAQDRRIQRQLVEKIESLAKEPRPQNCKLLHSYDKLYRIRSGDYRIIYQIDDTYQKVTVALIGHRRDVYRQLDR